MAFSKTIKKRFHVSQVLNENAKANNFSHLIPKDKFHIRYFLKNKKNMQFCCQQLFPNTQELVTRKYYENDTL